MRRHNGFYSAVFAGKRHVDSDTAHHHSASVWAVRKAVGTQAHPALPKNTMNLRFVEAFYWVASLKSVTRAAEKLFLTPVSYTHLRAHET